MSEANVTPLSPPCVQQETAMQHRPGMFADWTEMVATVGVWAAFSFFVITVLALVMLIWSLT